MEKNNQLKIIESINKKMDALERYVYLNLICEDISRDTDEFILATLREINEDIVYLKGIQEEVLNENKTPEKPEKCLYGYTEFCCYPIDDCRNCPARPENLDPYWGMSIAQFED